MGTGFNCFKMVWVLVFVFAAVSGWAQTASSPKKTRIGILMYSNETRYYDAAQGFKEALAQGGFREPGTEYTVASGDANKVRTAELVTQFAAAKYDLILALGTSASTALIRDIQDVPVVFSVVYDPVEAKIVKSRESSGNNTTGTSSYIPMNEMLETLRLFFPAKKLGVLYTPGEKNSEAQVKELRKYERQFVIKIIPVPLTNREDVIHLLPEVLRNTDSLFITGSNLVNAQVTEIVEMATRARVVTLTHLGDLVNKGVLIGLSANNREMGSLAGTKALRILRGARPSDIPIEYSAQRDLIINMKTAEKGGFTVPKAFLDAVKVKVR